MDRQRMISEGADALRIFTFIRRAVNESFDAGKLHITRTQQMILAAMSDGGTYSMSELARQICTSNEQATRAVSQLVGMGMIERSQNSTNHRVVNITLSEKAKKHLKETERYIAERIADMVENDDPEDDTISTETAALMEQLAKKF